jgi:hypothetical protein
MVGVFFRRVLWCFVVGGWPAVAALRMGLDPGWGMWLTLAGAPAEAGCALLLRRLHTGARRRRARETERRLDELEARAEAAEGLGERVADLAAVITLAFGYAGVSAPAHRRLRPIPSGDDDGGNGSGTGGVTRFPRRSRSASSSGRG